MAALADHHLVDLMFVVDLRHAVTLATIRVSDLRLIAVRSSPGGKKSFVVKRTGARKMSVAVKKIVVLRIKNASARKKEEEVKFVVVWRMNTDEKQPATRS
jgi:hypothetical protein